MLLNIIRKGILFVFSIRSFYFLSIPTIHLSLLSLSQIWQINGTTISYCDMRYSVLIIV
jgi:hypothetical protein